MKDDGGPAFPVIYAPGTDDARLGGMTLRDYFAAKAMQATVMYSNGRFSAEDVAESSYIMADAMIEEKKKESI